MYTTTLKRVIRNLKIFKRKEINNSFSSEFNKKLFYLIKKNNKKKLYKELAQYIDSLRYKKNKFNSQEKFFIKKTIKNVFFQNKQKYLNQTKQVSNTINIISLSGFGYSGTGAIHDFLRDSNNCIDALQGRELDIFKYQFSLNDLYRKSISRGQKINENELYKFLFNHIMGLPFPKGVTEDEINNRLVGSKALIKAVLRLPEDKKRVDLVKDICIFTNEIFNLVYVDNQKDYLELISRNLLNNIGKYYKIYNKGYLILNNWIPASSIHVSNLLPKNTKVIICTRDSLDAYYSWSTECPRIKYNYKFLIFPYIFLYFIRHIDYSKNFKLLDKKIKKDIAYIQFEEFIKFNIDKNEKYVFKDLIKLGIKEKFNFVKFNPNQSLKNINIYEREATKSFVKFIAIRLNIILNYLLKSFGYWTYKKNSF